MAKIHVTDRLRRYIAGLNMPMAKLARSAPIAEVRRLLAASQTVQD